MRSWEITREGKKDHKTGRLFAAKAILILCYVAKNRDADHLGSFIYDRSTGISDQEIEEFLDSCDTEGIPIPDYAFDCHTRKGKAQGKTKDQFFQDEFEALNPRAQGVFDWVLRDATS